MAACISEEITTNENNESNEKNDNTVHVTGVSLNKTSLSMKQGESAHLEALVFPTEAEDKTVTWMSDNTAIATVNEGMVTAIKDGTTIITVTTKDGSKTARCDVIVEKNPDPSVTLGADKISVISAVLHGKANFGKSTPSDLTIGFQYSKSAGILPSNSTITEAQDADEEYNFMAGITGLEPNTKYYFRSFIRQNGQDIYGETKAFTTNAISSIIHTKEPTSVSSVSATLLSDLDMTDVLCENQSYGFYYGDSAEHLNNEVSASADGNNKFAASLTNLSPSTPYYVQAYIVLDDRVFKEDLVSFTTKDIKSILVTNEATEIEPSSANLNGLLDLTDVQYGSISYGFYWGRSGSSESFFLQSDVSGKVMTASLTTLNHKTQYWYKAFVKLDDQRLYGEIKTFTTDIVPVESVSLNKTEYTFNEIGKTFILKATVHPTDATNKKIAWSSDNEAVAIVNNSGQVTATGNGSAKIIANTEDKEKTATCNITVIQLVTSIELNKTSLTLNEGETHELKPSVYPSNANDKSLVWVSSDPSIATVDANGKVTAVSKGETTIKALANDGSGVYATCWVYVIRKVSSIELNESAISLYPGQTKSIVATVIPSTANNTQLSWASYNPGVATVSDNGVITGIKAGSTTIIAKAKDGSGVYAICNVEVMRYVERIDLNHSIIYLDQGDKRQLTATIIPESAGNKTLNWSSSDEWIATVDQNGLVTAVSATGDPAFIYAYASDGSGMRACCTVYVMGAVDLGLSVKWANFNIGASTPTSYGNYYAWGEIETKDEYTWENYKFRSSGNSSNDIKFSKYNESSAFGNYGPIDNKTVLDPEDDVARVVLGNGWRMPTEKEVIELKNNCSWKEMGNGYYVSGLAKGYEKYCIFIPKSGNINGKTRENIGSDCYFWSASLFSLMFMGSPTFQPWCGSLVRASENNYLSVGGGNRYLGLPVRPVTD